MSSIFILIFSVISANAQTLELPTLDYGKDGVVVKHAPSNFTMKTRFRIQTRATYEDYELKASEQAGEVATVEQNVLPESETSAAPCLAD